MYKKIILHCGIHKTGSSYLQSVLSSNSDILRNYGIEYPEFRNANAGHAGNHSVVAVNYCGEADVFAYLSKFLKFSESVPNLLISGEEFSRAYILMPFLANLSKAAPSAEIQAIFYFRRFDHLLESVYSESVKRNLVGGIERASYDLDFAKLVRTAVDKLGPERVTIRPYNKLLWRDGSLGADFLTAIGIDGAFGEFKTGFGADVNASLSRTHTFILSCIAKKEDKQKMLHFFRHKKISVPDASRYFMTPKRRSDLNRNHISECKDYFFQLGVSDLANFLGTEDNIDEPQWAPFVPNRDAIDEYMREFVSAGNIIDMDDFTNELSKPRPVAPGA